MLVILVLLAGAFWQWWRMNRALETMTARLQQAAEAQRTLQRELARTRLLLEEQKRRLRALEASRKPSDLDPRREATQ